jgi:SAM-dependent methyltransferase
MTTPLPSPYDAPDLYDLALDGFQEDLPFWIEEARAGGGPTLEVACGTGRVLLRLMEQGLEVDGVDSASPMLERLRAKAAAKGLAPRLYLADMRDFTTPRRYARVFIAFNGFAHCETIEDQLRCLRCCREHLEPGGALIVHMSYPSQAYWLAPDGQRVLEMETPRPDGAGTLRMWDTRTKHPVAQRQESLVEMEEADADGSVTRTHRFATTQRWVYRAEFELLLRAAGFTRWEILGGWDRAPLTRDDQQMMAFGWKD